MLNFAGYNSVNFLAGNFVCCLANKIHGIKFLCEKQRNCELHFYSQVCANTSCTALKENVCCVTFPMRPQTFIITCCILLLLLTDIWEGQGRSVLPICSTVFAINSLRVSLKTYRKPQSGTSTISHFIGLILGWGGAEHTWSEIETFVTV